MQLHSKRDTRQIIRFVGGLSLAIAILVSLIPLSVAAQDAAIEPRLVTATNDSQTCGDQPWQITLQVWNVGSEAGDAYSEAVLSGYDCINGKFGDTLKQQFGTFSGGPNGIVTFESGATCQILEGVTVQCGGSGGAVFTIQDQGAFDTAPAVQITAEYIYTTYGIRVEDSFGDDQWEQKSWSEQELVLLDDVLKELPPDLLKEMAVTRIIRNKTYLEKNGNPDPDTFGIYYPCGNPPQKDCTGSSGTIRIFDKALAPFDFTDDPDGYKQFKGTILHELIHALQYKKDGYSIYKNAYFSPLVQNYMDATRPITDINDPGFEGTNGWQFGKHPPGAPAQRWKLFGIPDNIPPTDYGNSNPLEDMSESVMLYMYEPQKLKGTSMQRYNFIRQQIFKGVEYENGVQKQS